MVTLDVRFEPAEWVAAWKADARRVVLKAPPTTRVKDKVAATVQLAKPAVRATLVGTVVNVEKRDRHSSVEVALEAESLPAASMLLSAARGEKVAHRERAPRYLVKLPVVTSTGGPVAYASTVSISAGGCSLRWSGTLPSVGESVALSFRGTRSVEMLGVVRWRKPAGSTVGLAFVERTRGADAWRALVEEVRKSGAPAA